MYYAQENEKTSCLFIENAKAADFSFIGSNLFKQLYNAKHCDTCHNRHNVTVVQSPEERERSCAFVTLMIMLLSYLLQSTTYAWLFSTFIQQYPRTRVCSSLWPLVSTRFHFSCEVCLIVPEYPIPASESIFWNTSNQWRTMRCMNETNFSQKKRGEALRIAIHWAHVDNVRLLW